MDTTENNKIIAKFLGWEKESLSNFYQRYPDGTWDSLETLLPYEFKYHSDWNCLIEAIGKLNEVMESSLFKTEIFNLISSMILINDITGTYQYFTEALKHYNQQKQK